MSPVHVIVGEDQRAEAMWAAAFTGAVDLYRFPRNVDAFERLTAAEAPIDLVVLTPAQQGPFNITPDQFVARVLEGPLGSSRCLQNLHVIVVGQSLTRSHPRAMSVSTLDAAIRLVKFGEVERAPRPAAMDAAPVQPTLPAASHPASTVDAILAESGIAGSIISRIWDAPGVADPKAEPSPAPQQVAPSREPVAGGGARPAAQPVEVPAAAAEAPANPQLFSRAVATGFMAPATQPGQAPAPGAPLADPTMPSISGGGAIQAAMPQVGIAGESIEVASGVLQPARPYQLPNGGGYRGPGVRADRAIAGALPVDGGGQPVPPALTSQVQSMVYGAGVGNPNDPLLTWSSSIRDAAPVPTADAAAMHVVAPVAPGAQPMAGQQPRMVPLDPPAGVYGTPAPAPTQQVDPFLQRAEQGGGDVSFG